MTLLALDTGVEVPAALGAGRLHSRRVHPPRRQWTGVDKSCCGSWRAVQCVLRPTEQQSGAGGRPRCTPRILIAWGTCWANIRKRDCLPVVYLNPIGCGRPVTSDRELATLRRSVAGLVIRGEQSMTKRLSFLKGAGRCESV
jgi:hypothetical protein